MAGAGLAGNGDSGSLLLVWVRLSGGNGQLHDDRDTSSQYTCRVGFVKEMKSRGALSLDCSLDDTKVEHGGSS